MTTIDRTTLPKRFQALLADHDHVAIFAKANALNGAKNLQMVYAAATQDRVLAMSDYVVQETVVEVPFDQISTIGMRSTLGRAKVTIDAQGTETVIGGLSAPTAHHFVDMVRALMNDKEPTETTEVPQIAGDGIVEKLTELADLYRQGVLSDDEFSAAKARLLGN